MTFKLVKYFSLKFGLNKILLFADQVSYFVCGLKISPPAKILLLCPFKFKKLNSETHFTQALNFALTKHFLWVPRCFAVSRCGHKQKLGEWPGAAAAKPGQSFLSHFYPQSTVFIGVRNTNFPQRDLE